jgi:hypothetical protein
MCYFYWCFCYCCNKYVHTFQDSDWCGDVDCSRNEIITKYDKKMCAICIEIGCFKKKKFCDIKIIPPIIERGYEFFL